MFQKLKCFFGKHEWKFVSWGTRGFTRTGKKCKCCGIWGKSSTVYKIRTIDVPLIQEGNLSGTQNP